MTRYVLPILLIAAVAATSGAAVRSSDAEFIQQARDREDIDALMWRYVQTLDSLNPTAWADNFTPDGKFTTGPAFAAVGRDQLMGVVTGVLKKREEQKAKGEMQQQYHHMIANHHVSFVDKDHARITSYWLTFDDQPNGAPPKVAAAGRALDELVRVNGNWLIKVRDVAVPPTAP